VLVAEDDLMFRAILRNWLESWGYRVTMAVDGARAWEILQQAEAEAPQMLILDWMMPGISGLELCRLIRARNTLPYQYILLATAKDAKEDLIEGLDAGADDYLSKPFDRNELRARLRAGRRILTLQQAQTESRQELEFLATHDGLTGVWNRRAILDLLRREFELAARTDKKIGVMMLDVDHFKRVNDSFGHLAGDEVLKGIASRIQQAIRSYDLAGRYGGEEFLIVLPDCDGQDVRSCAERVRAAVADEPIAAEGAELRVTVSAGIAVLDPRANTEREALSAADAALYDAKRSGRNRVVANDLTVR
jgi:diguanylate cyclase (GGDEF)-like protein